MATLPSFAQQTYDSCIEQGLAATKAQHYDEAIGHFRQALRLSPNDIRNALIYANIAHIQEAKGENLKAIGSYDMALGIAPENLPILQSRAKLLFLLGNYNQAIIDGVVKSAKLGKEIDIVIPEI
jgi:tetratricopeptide (TPR) repeat protein